MMRLCPYEQLEKVGEKKLVLAEFEKGCKLETSSEPGPTNTKWIMRWRGKDGGIRNDKKVGGELEANFTFDFEKDASSSSADFQGMNIKFTFVHEEHMFVFKASKIANLVRECADAPWVVERKWSDLYNFRWSHDSDSESDSEPSSVKDAFVSLFTKNLNPVLQAVYGASPEAGEAVVECILNQLAPYRKPLGPEVTVTKSQKRSEKSVASDVENRAKDLGQIAKAKNKPTRKTGSVPSPLVSYLEKPPAWAWDVTGHWTVTSPMLAAVLGGQDMQSMSIQIMMANNPRHNKIGRQLWATFKFGGKLEGCMRFVPHVEEGARYWQLKDFEKACPLKDGSWPGPAPNGQREWLLRWRGMNPKTHEMSPCCDSYQTVVSFEINEQRQLTMKGVMTCNFQPTTFYATKVDEWVPSGGRDPTVATTWASY
jgi:hypothetical protein